MLRKKICLFLFLCYALSANAQAAKERISILVNAVQRAYNSDSDSLRYYYLAAVTAARNANDITDELTVTRLYADKLYIHGQPDTAITLMLDAAKKAEKYAPSAELARMYYSIGQVYSKNKFPIVAEGYLKKGINMAIFVKSNSAIGDGYNRIGIEYEKRQQLDSALYYYEQALHVNESDSTLAIGAAYSLENIAGIYAQQTDFTTALKYMKRALAIKLKVGTQLDLSMNYINVGEIFGSLEQYDSAIFYTQIALNISNRIRYADLEGYANQYLSGIYEHRGDFKKALAYNKRYTELNDSILTEKKTRQMAEMNAKYQAEKRDQRITELSQRATIQSLEIKQRNFLLYITIALLIITGVVTYLMYNRRKLRAEARLQAEINRQQTITTREVLNAEEKERKRIAADLHDGVGQMLSASLMNLNGFFTKNKIDKATDADAARIMALVTESYDELRAISHQMMPNALTKSGLEPALRELLAGIDPSRLTVTFECIGLENLTEETETVLYRVVQEAVNNVIKHAEAANMNIQIVKDSDGISVTIEDDGKGFDSKANTKKGIGIKNIFSRIQVQNGTVDIDSQPGMGTLVAIHIPL